MNLSTTSTAYRDRATSLRTSRPAVARVVSTCAMAMLLVALLFASGTAQAQDADAPQELQLTLDPPTREVQVGRAYPILLEARWKPGELRAPNLDLPTQINTDYPVAWTLTAPLEVDEAAGRLVAHLRFTPWYEGEIRLAGPVLELLDSSGATQAFDLDAGLVASDLVEMPDVGFGRGPLTSAGAPDDASFEDGDGATTQAADVSIAEEVPTGLAAQPTFDPPRTVGEITKEYGPAALAILLAAVAAIALLRRAAAPRIIPELPPADWATAEFARLDAMLPLRNLEAAVAFHFALADVLRAYCGRRWVFFSARMTTTELLRALERLAPDLDDASTTSLRALLDAADEVKFANAPADEAACRDRLERARTFVNATAPSADATAASASVA